MAGLATRDGGKALNDVVNCRANASAAKAQNQQNETQENKTKTNKTTKRQNNKTRMGELRMGRKLTALLVGGAFAAAMSGSVLAHHSFAMFDTENPVDLVGTVQEFKFTSPHTFILLQVKGQDASPTVWNLEGQSPSALVRDGWSSKTLKPGDELNLTVQPLRSGAPGGAWGTNKIKFKDGKPVVVSH
jgi:hypothetical protein